MPRVPQREEKLAAPRAIGTKTALPAFYIEKTEQSVGQPVETDMPKSSLAPAVRAIVFFGLMGTAVASLTLGAGLQMTADQSSTSVALAKGETGYVDSLHLASVDRSDRSRSAAKRAIASPSQQALADGPRTHIIR